jgi:hypothetical protein
MAPSLVRRLRLPDTSACRLEPAANIAQKLSARDAKSAQRQAFSNSRGGSRVIGHIQVLGMQRQVSFSVPVGRHPMQLAPALFQQ